MGDSQIIIFILGTGKVMYYSDLLFIIDEIVLL